jgi:hypothetical protein
MSVLVNPREADRYRPNLLVTYQKARELGYVPVIGSSSGAGPAFDFVASHSPGAEFTEHGRPPDEIRARCLPGC